MEARARGREPVLVAGPSELGKERLRIENAPRAWLRPVGLGEADDPDLVDVRVRRRAGVEQHDAARPQARGERLAFNPSPHGARQFRD